MRLGRPLAAASAVAAMTGASLIASPALANDSNRNSTSSPSSSSSPSPSGSSETSPTPSSSSSSSTETSSSSSFKITQEKTFVSASTNTSFTVSGTGCSGQQATVGIALYAPDGTASTSSRPRPPRTAPGPRTSTWRHSSSPSAPRPQRLPMDGPSAPAA